MVATVQWSTLNRTHKLRSRALFILGMLALLAPLGPIIIHSQFAMSIRECNSGIGRCDRTVLPTFYASFATLIFIPIFIAWLRSTPRFLRVLQKEPQRVTWLYIRNTTLVTKVVGVTVAENRNAWQTIVAGLDDGATVELEVKDGSAGSIASVFDAFAALAPNAAIGFTEERAVAFARDPRSLRRAA
jgi:hypothetical protein